MELSAVIDVFLTDDGYNAAFSNLMIKLDMEVCLNCFGSFFRGFALILALVSAAPSYSAVGLLQYAEDDSGEGYESLGCIEGAVATPDGRFVYAGSFCDKALVSFARDPATGVLTPIATLLNDDTTDEQGVSPYDDLLISPDGLHLYVSGMTNEGDDYRRALFVFDIDSHSGALTQKQIFDNFGDNVGDLKFVMTADGKNIYSADANGGVMAIGRAANGMLSSLQFIDNETLSEDFWRNERIWNIKLSADQDYLYITTNPHHVFWLKRDESSGALTWAGEVSGEDIDAFLDDAIIDFVISPDDRDFYGFTWDDRLIHLRIEDDRSLSLISVTETLPENHINAKFYCPVTPQISANGRLFYLVDACSDDLQVWSRNLETGELIYRDAAVDGEQGMPDGLFSQMERTAFNHDGHQLFGMDFGGLAVFDLTVDLTLSLDFPDVANADEVLDFELEIENQGAAIAHDLVIKLDIGNFNASDAQITGQGGVCLVETGVVTCTLNRLPTLSAERISMILRSPLEAGDYDLTIATTQAEIDKDESNNQILHKVTVNADVTPEVGATASDESSDGGALSLWILLLGSGMLIVRKRRF